MVRTIRHAYLCAGGLLFGALLAPAAWGEDEAAKSPIAAAAVVSAPTDDASPGKADDVAESPVVTPAKPSGPSSGETDVEMVRERYPDGKIKVEREVIRDAQENYINHGQWKMWDPKGNVVGEGRYVNGLRQGAWTGWYMRADVPLLSDMPYREYKGPFVSQAEFNGGKLNGPWTIHDAEKHKISEWHYLAGRRHGSWTSWYANGRKMREGNYLNGALDGRVSDWSPEGVLTTNETYQAGHKLARKVAYFAESQKKSEGMYLFAKQELETDDDWWDAKLSKFTTLGKDERHGESISWHPNGQVHVQGAYEHDAPVGTHTWWYANGQKAVEGPFTKGQRHGQWSWYHPNGQKSTQGEFMMGGPHGKWIWWSPAGKVAQKVDYSAGGKSVLAAVVADKPQPRDREDSASQSTQAAEPKTIEDGEDSEETTKGSEQAVSQSSAATDTEESRQSPQRGPTAETADDE